MSREERRAFLSDWGTTAAVMAGVATFLILIVVGILDYFLIQQLHTVLIQEHKTTLAVIQDELLRKTKGAVVVKGACIIVELVNKALPAGQHISTQGCPPIHLPLK